MSLEFPAVWERLHWSPGLWFAGRNGIDTRPAKILDLVGTSKDGAPGCLSPGNGAIQANCFSERENFS